MKLVELHILQSFPVTCLNRDDVGAPKSAYFGGVPRARVSSQCWKRAIRLQAKEMDGNYFAGIRTRYVVDQLRHRLEEKGADSDAAQKAAMVVGEALGSKDASRGDAKTMVLLFFSATELDNLADAVWQQMSSGKKVDTKAGELKKLLTKTIPQDGADIAIFGRMVANDPTLNIEGAGLFSHAISTHEVVNDIDYFTAVDDCQREDTEGAGHLGVLEFNAACYYRYIGLNWDLLTQNLNCLPVEQLKHVLSVFLKAAILAVPNARKNSMFGQNPPGYVLGLVRTGQPLSLANAFESPVSPRRGFLEPSYEALQKYFETLKTVYKEPYGDKIRVELWLATQPKNGQDLLSLEEFTNRLVEGVAHD